MTLETFGFIVGVAGTLLAALVAYLSSDDEKQNTSVQATTDDYRPQPTYYSAPQWTPPAYNPPTYSQPTTPVVPTTVNPWGTMAYVSAIANTQIPTPSYDYSSTYYNTNLGYSAMGPQWDPPAATNYGVGNDIRPSPTGAPPGWTPPQFAPPSAYW